MTANPGALSGWYRPRQDLDSQTGAEESAGETTGQAATGNAADTKATTAKSTTGGGRDDQSPVVVWEAANRMEAEIVAGRLHSENIPAIIRGESLGAIYGLTTGSLAAATVLVPAPLAEKALALLHSDVEWDDSDQADAEQTDVDHTDTLYPGSGELSDEAPQGDG